MVAYMRATMYMHGQSRNPPWDELKTSLVVASVALGVGLGSPLAGYLSGGKIELGLVPLGCVGMILAAMLSAIAINHTAALVVALVVIGFFTGFYMVPLYTLLQHRAPKQSKGELIATSNFINVTGAIAASVLFYVLVSIVHVSGVTPVIQQVDRVAAGKVTGIEKDDFHGKIHKLTIEEADGDEKIIRVVHKVDFGDGDAADFIDQLIEHHPHEDEIEFDDNLLEVLGGGIKDGDEVVVSRYEFGGVQRYRVRREGQPLRTVYDERGLPRWPFFGAAVMATGILWLLLRKLPDFFVRTLFWCAEPGPLSHLRRRHAAPAELRGPVILATNCDSLEAGLHVVSVTDRSTLFVLWESPEKRTPALALADVGEPLERRRDEQGGPSRLAVRRRTARSRPCGTAIYWRSPWTATRTTKSNR